MKYLIAIILFVNSCSQSAENQSSSALKTVSDISQTLKFDIKNYGSNTIQLFQNGPEEPEIFATLTRPSSDAHFTYSGKIASGQYFIQLLPNRDKHRFFVSPGENFTWMIDLNKPKENQFSDSKDNANYSKYLKQYNDLKQQYSVLKFGNTKATKEDELKSIGDKIYDLRNDYLNTNRGTSAKWVLADKQVVEGGMPWYHEDLNWNHSSANYETYWKNFDLSNDALSTSNFILKRLDYYLNSVCGQEPEQLEKGIDFVLAKANKAPKTFQLFQQFIRRKYKKPDDVRHEGLYVYLVDKYYKTNQVPLESPKVFEGVKRRAEKIRPALIGKPAPDFRALDYSDKSVAFSDIKAPYKVLLFWKPGCDGCEYAMPILESTQKLLNDDRLAFVTLCTKQGDEMQECKDSHVNKNMKKFTNLIDTSTEGKTNFYNLFTPDIFVIGPDGKIIDKHVKVNGLATRLRSLMKG